MTSASRTPTVPSRSWTTGGGAIRMGSWQQWRRVRTTVRPLLALGTGQRQAMLTALSSQGYWPLSKTLATHSGMTTTWLPRQGLISVRDLWLHAPGSA